MAQGLDVIIVDDDARVCKVISEVIESFYTWGRVLTFTDAEKAIGYCLNRKVGLAVFVVDVFLQKQSGFYFLDAVEPKFPSAHEDAIIITGNASDDVVDMCVASGVNHLLEKPVRSYALQLAVRSIVSKYLHFSRKLMEDPEFAGLVARM